MSPALPPRVPRTRRLERDLLAEVRHVLNRLDGVTVWRNVRGYDEARKVRYGLCPGASDLVGVVSVLGVGVALFVELKSPGRPHLEPDQKTFREVVTRLAAIHVVAQTAEEAAAAVEMARDRLKKALEKRGPLA